MPTLDTSFLIDLIRQKPEAMAKINELIEVGIPLVTPTINILELYRVAFLSASIRDNLQEGKDHSKCAH